MKTEMKEDEVKKNMGNGSVLKEVKDTSFQKEKSASRCYRVDRISGSSL
jgi:hypothetical protein